MKKLLLNCDTCDTRKMREDAFEGYESVTINADIIFVNDRSRKILEQSAVCMNADMVLNVGEEEVVIQEQNGVMEIKPGKRLRPEKKAILFVNGKLIIEPGTEEILENYQGIYVNGQVCLPESVRPFLAEMKVNGVTECYPDDSIRLKRTAVIDEYFACRVQERAVYYAAKQVVLLEEKADLALLREKQVHFVTKKLVVSEALVREALPLFDMDVEVTVVPEGCKYVPEDAVLEEDLLKKYGTRMFIEGDLSLGKGSEELLGQVECLRVKGDIKMTEKQKQVFLQQKIDAAYGKIVLRKENVISRRLSVTVGESLLAAYPEGICISDCVKVELAPELTPEQIKELLEFENCTKVVCSKEQKDMVEMVSENVVRIGDDEEKKEAEAFDGTVINVDEYVL
ncbi:MAG: hypothetical protein J5986_14790 [Roseburia sp.]|nr:hypothetical protein [Roseburia sp.]